MSNMREATFCLRDDDKLDVVSVEVSKLLDEYVRRNDVSVSQMSAALEGYREMLAINSIVKPNQK